MNKVSDSATAAVADIGNGASLAVGGFGLNGIPDTLMRPSSSASPAVHVHAMPGVVGDLRPLAVQRAVGAVVPARRVVLDAADLHRLTVRTVVDSGGGHGDPRGDGAAAVRRRIHARLLNRRDRVSVVLGVERLPAHGRNSRMPPRKRTDLEAQRDTAGSDSEDSNASTSSVTTVPIVATTINGDGQPEALPIVVGAPDTMPELPEPLHPEREHAIYFEPGDLVPPQFLAQGMSGQIYNYSQATGAWLKAKAEPILSFAAKALPLATTVAATFTEGATSTNLQKASTYLAAAEAATNVGVTAYKAFTDPNVNRGQAAMSVVGSLASVGGTVMSAQAAVPERTQKQVQQLTTLGSAFIALGSATSYTQRPTQESFLPLTESPSQTASGDSVRQDNSNTSLPTDTYAMNRLPTANSALASSPSVASLQSPGAGSNTHPTARTSALPQPPPKAVTVTKRTGNAP